LGDTSFVITDEGKEIEYSFMCSSSYSFPPEDCGYRLVYENNEGNFRIKYNPYSMDYIGESIMT